MSIEKEVEVYTYTVSILNLSLKVKFPCKIYLEHAGNTITNEVAASSPNKFLFNQEVTLKNDTDKDYIEVVVQLVTDKGAKYVGGVLRFVQKELIGSEGERIVINLIKCLDGQAFCEVRVDQVATSRVIKKDPQGKKKVQKTEYGLDFNAGWSAKKNNLNQGETKSEFNMPLSMGRGKDKPQINMREPTLGASGAVKKGKMDIMSFDKDPALSMVGGMSSLEFQVYKQGYNKLKEKYRKQAENARSQLNKRMALEGNENNLKLQIMRYKLKTEQLEKTLAEKNSKIKQLTQNVSNFQKKQLDIKYMKQEVQNKIYTIKNLQETIKTLTKDNSQLKNLQNLRTQNEQQSIRSLKQQIQKYKKQLQNKENDLLRQTRIKNDTITKRQYQLHTKSEELERAKCVIEDLQKTMSNKLFEWQKVQQSQKAAAKTRQDELKQKIVKAQNQKAAVDQKVKDLQQLLQQKRTQTLRIDYDRKVITQNYQSLQKAHEQLRSIREKYLQLIRQHKLVGDQKNQNERNKQRQIRLKQTQIEELSQKLNNLSENSKKSLKQLQQKYKANQIKLIESESQNEILRNQLEKSKRQNESLTKEALDAKNSLKQLKADAKDKEERLLALTNQLSDSKNRYKQTDYSCKLDLQRQKAEVQKLSKGFQDEIARGIELTQTVSRLQLQASKNRMEWQFKEDKATKELNYAKQKMASLQTFKYQLEAQLSSSSQTIAGLKTGEKTLNEKIQKLELQAIKSRETVQKLKKDIKVLEEKLQNSESNTKSKTKDLADQIQLKEVLEKKISEQEAQLAQLKNDLNKQTNQKTRNQKIVEILQGDITKAKEEQQRLNGVISAREKTEDELRDQLKKQKEEYTKLDMRQSALKKEYQKFKQTLVDNLNTTFTSIPDGTLTPAIKQSKVLVSGDKTVVKENNEILSLLTFLGKQARTNMNKLIENYKTSMREIQKVNTEFSSTINKSNTNQFEFNQNINLLKQEISELMEEKQNTQNKYEEEIFLLEGRVRQKDAVITQLTQQIEEMDFTNKNTKAQLDAFREQTAKKEANRTKLINELRDQIEYQLTTISMLQGNEQKLHEQLDTTIANFDQKADKVNRLQKELSDTNDNLHLLDEQNSSLKRQLKKINERADELGLELISEKEESQKLRQAIQDEEKKASELRQFVNGLMKQKEDIIKKQLEKSQQLLEHETRIEEIKHDNQWLTEQLKKYKKKEEQMKDELKKLAKGFKQEETAKTEQKNKNAKLSEKLKDRQKDVANRDETIAKLQEKLKKEKEKTSKDLKQMETQLDETYVKLLNKQKESNQKIISLESQNERLKTQNQKLKQQINSNEQAIFTQKNKNENTAATLNSTEKQLNQALQKIKNLDEKVHQFEQEVRVKEEENYKLQGKIYSFETKLDQKESQKIDRLENLHKDWDSKYEGMIQQYEQRLELIEKQKLILKDRVDQKQKELKKQANQIKMQENNISVLKKGFQQKIKSLEQDRLSVISQKNTENQRLIEENRVNFDNLKQKQSECRKINSQLQFSKATIAKLQIRLKESEQKLRNINRTYQKQVQEMKKKEQAYKRLKQNALSSVWKSQREVRKVIQAGVKKILDVVDETSTIKVMEVTKHLEQNVVSAISIKIQQKQAEKQ